ncbi:ABC transporter substrate-binding protein [Mycolicibacterium nivoides]|nr:ABC transporter substrate-binding protein [Mycolicibacterium nivoides]MBN3510525.1 ABC transporter substrate-binding protein [Mycolicibacterium septicum]QRY46144.1 ABC transporter substrate-binding protein [Mycolicibacterium boenickei]SEQ59941.1 peptide/nickel transport system substrate-binding protein [Mycobacterium sp. 88mf]SFF69548.1 peptide/nickel transport system substrate-binding protein [Mycobacterium sp. 455mf]
MLTNARSAVTATALVVAITAAMTGCSGDRPPAGNARNGEGTVETAFTTAPAKGPIDHFTWNLANGEPASLDWILAYSDSENATLANMCESLMVQNEDMTLSPGLAERIDRPDDKTMVITIRDGVKFWNGAPMTTEDVVFSLSRNLDPKAGSYWASPFYDRVDSIQATGDRQVTVRFKQPDAIFERMLSTAAGVIGNKQFVEHAGSAYGTASGGIMCTGPLRFDSWKPGKTIEMTKNPDYWNAANAAKADRAALTFVTDEATITSSLLSGDIDGTHRTPLSAMEPLRSSGKGKFYLGAGTDWLAIRPTERPGPMQNKDVRHALSMALDRQGIVNGVYHGTAEASLTPIQSGAWGYSRPIFEAAAAQYANPARDVEGAKKLTADGGHTGQSISVAYPAELEAETKTAQLLADAGREIGIDVKVVPLPVTSFTNLYFDKAARAAYDAFIVGEYGAGVAEPLVSLSEFTPLSAYNYGALNAPGLTDNVRAAYETFDNDERARKLVAAQAAAVDEVAMINVANPRIPMYMNNRITGATPSIAFLYFPWAAKVGAA